MFFSVSVSVLRERVLVLVHFIHLITAAVVFFSVSVFFGKRVLVLVSFNHLITAAAAAAVFFFVSVFFGKEY